MPDRIIRERARRSPTLLALSDGAVRAWWNLVTAADDHGRFEANTEYLLNTLFPRRPVGWTVSKMARVIMEWETADLIHLYAVDARVYGHSPTWFEHQRRRTSRPKYPDPPCGNVPERAEKCREGRLPAIELIAATGLPRSVSQNGVVAANGGGPQQILAYSESRESRVGSRESGAARHAAAATGPPAPAFQIPESIRTALGRCRVLTRHPRVSDPEFWQSQIRAHPAVNFPHELLEAEAWCIAKPTKAPRSDFAGFLHGWFKRAAADLEDRR